MKKLILLTLIILSAISTLAQDSKSILDKAYAIYEKSDGIQFDFNLKTADEAGNQYQPQKGAAYIKGNKFKLKMTAAETWFDGNTQWVWMKTQNEVNISNPSPQEVASISPSALLGMYKKDFLLKKPLSKIVNGYTTYIIEMTPTSKNNNFKKIIVAVNKRTYHIMQLQSMLQNGIRSSIDLKNFRSDKHFNDTTFVFNAAHCPDVEIIDLR